MTKVEAPNQGHKNEISTDALNWLNVTGEYLHRIPAVDSPYNRANTAFMRHLGNMMAHGDYDTANILSTLEDHARSVTSDSSWISDAETQNTIRHNQFYMLAHIATEFVGK